MLKETLQKVTTALDELRVPYALIGGLAVITRGVVRATQDIDLLVDWPVHQAKALAESLNGHGIPATFEKGAPDDPVAGLIRIVIPQGPSPVRCDILFPSRPWQAAAVRNAEPVDLDGFVVPVVGTEDLFLLKLRAGGPQDLLDAAELLRMQSPAVQKAWGASASRLRMSAKYKQCLKFLREMD